MKTNTTNKKLIKELSDYLFNTDYYEQEDRPLESYIREFYAARFGCNNEKKEKQLLEAYRSN